ncbi:MAG: alpha-galactosidase [Armatimonadota bacterium]
MAREIEIENEFLIVSFDQASGRFQVTEKAGGRTFLVDGRLAEADASARIAATDDETFGPGKAIEVSHPGGDRDRLMLFPGMRFVLLRSSLHNGAAEPMIIDRVRRASVGVDLGAAPDGLRALGTAGLTPPDGHSGSYAYLAIADPGSRNGVVAGWLTHDRGSGVVFSSIEHGRVRITAQTDYGRLRVPPGAREDTETLAIGYFDDARLGLEAWADAIARVYEITLPPQPAGYCTWYSRPHGGASDEEHIADLAEFAAEHLKPFGFSFVQIDDKWQEGERRSGPAKNFTTHRPTGPYPSGMKAAADSIKAVGLTPGIWFMPFAGDHEDPLFEPHADWFVTREGGEPYETRWGGTSLDMTHPGARGHLRGVASRITRDWGYRYLKMDGLWTGTATKQMYVNNEYRDDGIGDAVFHDPTKTNIEAYRAGLELAREAAGEDVFILGCCAPQNMRSFGGAFGLVDAMRIGPDNGAGWPGLLRGPVHGSRKYFLHGRVWYNDPDPVYVRESMPLEHARLVCSWVAISGQLTVASDWLPELPPDRLDILKRTMPPHGLLPRPVDLFERDPPRIWLLTDERRTPRRDVIGFYNWDDEPADFDCALDRIGLPRATSYVAFDYWQNALIQPIAERLQVSVPEQSCRILALRPVLDRPQLISTSRHITQGIVDVLEERWDARRRRLSGRSALVAGDPYELRVVARSPDAAWSAQSARVSPADRAAGVEITLTEANSLVRATINAPTSREVSWTLRFRQAPGPKR